MVKRTTVRGARKRKIRLAVKGKTKGAAGAGILPEMKRKSERGAADRNENVMETRSRDLHTGLEGRSIF
jgi:hypothetical protein